MTAVAIGIVVFLVLGLPLMAWAAGTWLPATRSRPGPQDPDLAFAREHGVRGLDFVRVQEAVAHGRAAPAPLRAAAAAYAVRVLSLDEQGRPPRPEQQEPSRWGRLQRWLRTSRRRAVLGLALVVLVYAALVVWAVRRGGFDFLVIQVSAQAALALVLARLARRGVRGRKELARAAVEANRPDPLPP